MAPMAKLDNEELGRLKEVNIDEASARRHVRDSLKDVQLNLDHILFKTLETGIKTKEVKEDKDLSYEVNSRGVEIFSKSWLPEALYIRMMNTQMDLWETSMLANKLKNIHDHLSETSLRLCYRHIEKQRSSESLKALHSLFDTTHIDNMKILTALIHPKPHITPLQDGMTKRKVHLDVLRRKTVLLLISDLNVKECANNQKV